MFQVLEDRIRTAVDAHVRVRYGASVDVTLEQPRQASFGEFATPVAFQLARELKKAPRAIAAEIAAEMPPIDGVAAIEVAGNGYLNVRLDRATYARALVAPQARVPEARPEKIVVEHTNINPNKAAHIGHLRNAVLGDTFVRMLRAAGHRVEVQNYIDNTGVQVADVVVGFHFLEKATTEDVRRLAALPRFDYYCWDLYARTSSYYADHREALEWRHATLHTIESGAGELAEIGRLVADEIVRRHFKTMARLDVTYDVLPRESEILHLQFWAKAFEQLRERGAIFLETEGKNKGCWVMPASAFKSAASEEESDGEDSKVIVRSNGTVTYVGKDIAYQLWKFGLLGKDFYYRPFDGTTGARQVWVTTDQPGPSGAPSFGAASRVYNVIDSRQAYLQDVVAAGLRALGYDKQADNSIHFSYEMVALSPSTCVELGIELSEEDKKRAYVEVSGRKGLGVKADDLIDKLIEKAQEEVDSRHPEAPPDERRAVAEQIAVGALRYFMLKFTRNTVIAFDLSEALSFEGETGPYVQYAAVRARGILRKAGEPLPDFQAVLTHEAMARSVTSEDLWQLLLAVSRTDSALARSIASGEPSHLARYAFQVAQAFNNFYHAYPVITEENAERRVFLLWMTSFLRSELERTLAMLGISVPPYM